MEETKKPMVVEIKCIDWVAPISVQIGMRKHLTIPLTIEYLAKHRVFQVCKPDSYEESLGFNKERFEYLITHLLIGEYEHTMRTYRYLVRDWGDSPATLPTDDFTSVVVSG